MPRKAPSFAVHDLIGVLGATMIGGFIAGAPVVGLAAGAAGTVSILYMSGTWRRDGSPSPPQALPSTSPGVLLTLGADGLCVTGMFQPWFHVRSVSVQDDCVTVHFCDGKEWYFVGYGAAQIAQEAKCRMRWALDAKTPYLLSPSSYRVAGRYQYNEALGLPVALRVDRRMDERVEDYQGLDADVQRRVLHSIADPPTGIAFAQADRREFAPTG